MIISTGTTAVGICILCTVLIISVLCTVYVLKRRKHIEGTVIYTVYYTNDILYIIVEGAVCIDSNPAYGESNLNILLHIYSNSIVKGRLQTNPAYEVVKIHCNPDYENIHITTDM